MWYQLKKCVRIKQFYFENLHFRLNFRKLQNLIFFSKQRIANFLKIQSSMDRKKLRTKKNNFHF